MIEGGVEHAVKRPHEMGGEHLAAIGDGSRGIYSGFPASNTPVEFSLNGWLRRFSVVAVAALVTACASNRPAPDALYTRLGGTGTIDALAHEFSVRMLGDPRLEPYLRRVGEAHFEDTIERHLCSVARGPCQSIGRNLKFYFEERGIEGDDFLIALAHLSSAMTAMRLPSPEQAELHTRLLGECGRKKRRGC